MQCASITDFAVMSDLASLIIAGALFKSFAAIFGCCCFEIFITNLACTRPNNSIRSRLCKIVFFSS